MPVRRKNRRAGNDESCRESLPAPEVLSEDADGEEDRRRGLEVEEERARDAGYPGQAVEHEDGTDDAAQNGDGRENRCIGETKWRLGAPLAQRSDGRQDEAGAEVEHARQGHRPGVRDEDLPERCAEAEETGGE